MEIPFLKTRYSLAQKSWQSDPDPAGNALSNRVWAHVTQG